MFSLEASVTLPYPPPTVFAAVARLEYDLARRLRPTPNTPADALAPSVADAHHAPTPASFPPALPACAMPPRHAC